MHVSNLCLTQEGILIFLSDKKSQPAPDLCVLCFHQNALRQTLNDYAVDSESKKIVREHADDYAFPSTDPSLPSFILDGVICRTFFKMTRALAKPSEEKTLRHIANRTDSLRTQTISLLFFGDKPPLGILFINSQGVYILSIAYSQQEALLHLDEPWIQNNHDLINNIRKNAQKYPISDSARHEPIQISGPMIRLLAAFTIATTIDSKRSSRS